MSLSVLALDAAVSDGLLQIRPSEQTITIGGGVAIVVLIAFSGFFSSSEIALFSLPDHKVDAMVAQSLPNADLVAELKEDPHRLLVTILVGNNVANIAMSSITTVVLGIYFTPAESVVVATFGITSLVLLFGESAPKSYAVEHTETWARRVARPLQLTEYALYPLVVLFDFLTRGVNRLTGTSGEIEAPYVTREEVEQLIETGTREGVFEVDERDILRQVFQFRNRIAKEIMTPRLDVIAVSATASLEDAIDSCLDANRDRLPLYEETRDSIVGIVELADLVRAVRRGEAPDLVDAAGPALHVPETKPVDELLEEMREQHRQMAIVVDEFGATQGLVTLEDILEEVVGEMLEEAEHPPIEAIDDRTIRVQGNVNVHEVNEELGVELPEGETFESIAGYVFARLGRIPEIGEIVEYDGVRINVESVDDTRIETLQIERFDDEPSRE